MDGLMEARLKIEAKITSRAADLYRQLLSKEVTKSNAILKTMKKPIGGARKTGKTGVLVLVSLLRRIYHTLQPSEDLYDQKPEEVPVQQAPANSSNSTIPTSGASFASRFE